jgi:hypothetical protein
MPVGVSCQPQHQAKIRVTRSEILDSPFSSQPSLKAEVRRRLDDIAAQTNAHIAVVNSQMSLSNRTPPDGISSNAGWSGLETERVCELVVTGSEDSVGLARVRLLVMLDELVRVSLICCVHPSPTSRAASIPRYAKSTRSFMPSSLAENDALYKLSTKRPARTFTFLLLSKVSLGQTQPRLVAPTLATPGTKSGLPASFSAFRGRGICSIRSL